jgi:hypothetical protein
VNRYGGGDCGVGFELLCGLGFWAALDMVRSFYSCETGPEYTIF